MAEYCICNIVYCKLMYPLAVTTLTQNQGGLKTIISGRTSCSGLHESFPTSSYPQATLKTGHTIPQPLCRTDHLTYYDYPG